MTTYTSCYFSGTVNDFNGKLVVNVEWSPPTETYGEIKSYRLRYGPRGKKNMEVFFIKYSDIYCNVELIPGVNKISSTYIMQFYLYRKQRQIC